MITNNVPYTYLIKHIPSDRIYYGVRFAKNCSPDDLFVTYFTSSKEIKQLIKTDGVSSFTFEIRRIFDDATKARLWESNVLRRMKVMHHPIFINMSIGPQPGITHNWYGNPSPRKGCTLSAETKQKLSISKLGKKASDETKLKLRLARRKQIRSPMSNEQKLKISNTKRTTGLPDSIKTKQKKSKAAKTRPPVTDETRKKLSIAKKGIIKSPEHLQKILDTKQKKKQYILVIILLFLYIQLNYFN